MMGRQGGVQDHLFYSFNLDDHVPHTHLLRGLDSGHPGAMPRNRQVAVASDGSSMH
jgi:hypothetical protein